MPDTAKIIEAVNGIHKSMDAGFIIMHKKIDQHNERLTEVEAALAIKKALCKERKEVEAKAETTKKDKRDYWKFIIRAVSIAGIFALASIAWEKIKAILDLVP
jgi:uncharacterized Fe-S center protein